MTGDKPQSYVQPLRFRARSVMEQPKGLPIIDVSFNESPYPPTVPVQRSIQQAALAANRYGNPSCSELRHALARRYSLDETSIICGNGSEELLDIIGRNFARPGDEIVMPEFGYIQFPIIANRTGATLVKAPEHHYTTEVDSLLGAVSARTTLVFVANPNNPTGTCLPIDELTRLARALPTRVVLVIDLAYAEFVSNTYCHQVHDLARRHENIIVTRTFSKAYGLAGLRVGWCHVPLWMADSLNAIRGMGVVNAAAQAAALTAMNERNVIVRQIEQIQKERQRVSIALSALGFFIAPSAANFLMMGVTAEQGLSASEMARSLFDNAGILVNQTRETGLESFIRFSLSTPVNNDLIINAVTELAIGQP